MVDKDTSFSPHSKLQASYSYGSLVKHICSDHGRGWVPHACFKKNSQIQNVMTDKAIIDIFGLASGSFSGSFYFIFPLVLLDSACGINSTKTHKMSLLCKHEERRS